MSTNWQDLVSKWHETDSYEAIQAEIKGLKWIDVTSSNLASVAYEKNKYVLFIAFLDGLVYRYEGVPEAEYLGLMEAYDSHGEYFYDNIRMVYPFRRVE